MTTEQDPNITSSDPKDGTTNITPDGFPEVMKDALDRPSDVRAKVDGRDMIVPGTEVPTLVQKGLAAEKRFEEAAKMRKEAEEALKNWEDVKALMEGDDAAFRRVGKAVGMPEEKIQEALRLMQQQQQQELDEGTEDAPSSKPSASEYDGEIPFHKLPRELQNIVVRNEKERIVGIVKNFLDKDPDIGYNMKSATDASKEAVLKMVMEKVSGRLRSTNSSFDDGSRVMQEILPDVKAILALSGSHTRENLPIGIGPSPNGERSSVHPMKEPDHVSSQDPNHEQHILEVLQYNMQKAADGSL